MTAEEQQLLSTLDADLRLATELARSAGRTIVAVKSEAIASTSITTKSDDSPVTKADLAADAIIRAGLVDAGRVANGDRIVTEETHAGADVPGRGRVWFIDPIDGTEEFIAGRPDYVVQIGLCIDGQPVLGVIFQPETGRTWRGIVAGETLAARRCERIVHEGDALASDALPRAVHNRALAGPARVAVSVSHPSAVVDFIVGHLGGVPVAKGSVGLKVGMIVDDEADAYLTASRRIKVWDTCAPAAVLLAAGGVVSNLDGGPLAYSGPAAHPAGVMMWTPAAARALRARVDEAVARYRQRDTQTSG